MIYTFQDRRATLVEVRVENLTKIFDGEVIAVQDVSFKVEERQILTLLGPSGCGKSTILRTIAGFNIPEKGRVLFGDRDVTHLPPQDRYTGMCFQNYAIWPHMSVFKNIEFGLQIREIEEKERKKRVKNALESVRMEEYGERMPNELSGGQQQRVALARALVVNPDVLLLDEPLSNLDAKLRIESRQKIRDLVKEMNLTAIYVTHDQAEALSISDIIAVLDRGHLRQIGTPREVWENPENAFVATFIGEANTINMVATSIDGNSAHLELKDAESGKAHTFKSEYLKGVHLNDKVAVVIRPELMFVSKSKDPTLNQIQAKVRSVMYFGTFERIVAVLPDQTDVVIHRFDQDIPIELNDNIFIHINPKLVYTFGPENL
ncbi:MAG: ABC transporter ATP-binding protein [Candidatus Heimdallarchaeota archaeon]|nr:ABC transporter ATP-binding protein [Candidatus Heimdallarchaeota archaeon]